MTRFIMQLLANKDVSSHGKSGGQKALHRLSLKPAPEAFWSLSKEVALQSVSAGEAGLSSGEAEARLKQFGPNSIKAQSRSSSLVLFLSQFKSPITLLLIIAALLSMSLGDVADAIIILVIILVSSFLGFWQERGAANAVKQLLKMVQIKCCLLRDEKEEELPVEQVVAGDIVVLNAGDMIPADSYLLEAKELYVDEAAFTGETFPVVKQPGIVAADAPLAKRTNALFMGSHVISGEAKALVVKTGKETEFGKVSDELRTRAPETDFEKGIRHFGYMLMEITLVLVIIIFGINVLLHKPPLDSILFSLALAVGLTPQLLPAIISINLSVGAKEMAKKQVIVKRLSSIENFGSMNILCSDKTGTITEGKVTVKDVVDTEGQHSQKALQYACLNALLQKGFTNPIDNALRTVSPIDLKAYAVQTEIPYDFLRKRLSIQVQHGAENLVITKGAFDAVLDVCNRVEITGGSIVPMEEKRGALKKVYEDYSADGQRVLGLAYTSGSSEKNFSRQDEKEMIFLGLILLVDPLKEGMQETIAQLEKLGVKLKLITGDNALVANSLAKQLGMEKPVVLTRSQLREMSDRALFQRAAHAQIFAEVEPNQKERIILALKKRGYVVGFMGDGINDAPALHAADVGISVDSAVDVAKEAADIVLLSQSLQVLQTGIVAGRKTFVNTMKYIFMATSANFGNMFSMAGASLFLPFLPLLPKQILLTNLLTDFPEMAIASDRVDTDLLQKPQRWDLKFIQRFMFVFGLISSFFDYLTFGVLLLVMHANEKLFQTGWFTESVISATMIVLVVRTRQSFFKSRPGKYLAIATVLVQLFVLVLPYLPFAGLLGFAPLPLAFYGWMFVIVAAYVFTAEMAKRSFYKKTKKRG
jgi:P-type Mg2+ transporter